MAMPIPRGTVNTDTMDDGVASLLCHREYLRALGQSDEQAAETLRGQARAAGEPLGLAYATTWEVLRP